MGAKTGNLSAPAESQAIRRRQEDVLNQAGRASMLPGREPGSAFTQRQAQPPGTQAGIEFGPGRSRRYWLNMAKNKMPPELLEHFKKKDAKKEDGTEMSDKEKRKAALDKARKYKEQKNKDTDK